MSVTPPSKYTFLLFLKQFHLLEMVSNARQYRIIPDSMPHIHRIMYPFCLVLSTPVLRLIADNFVTISFNIGQVLISRIQAKRIILQKFNSHTLTAAKKDCCFFDRVALLTCIKEDAY